MNTESRLWEFGVALLQTKPGRRKFPSSRDAPRQGIFQRPDVISVAHSLGRAVEEGSNVVVDKCCGVR
jgi:hypothetical protein